MSRRQYTPEGYAALVEKGRAAAMRQSEENQARNIAKGKPPLRYVAEGRSLGVLDDPVSDALWLEEGIAGGVITPDMGRVQARRTAARLADAVGRLIAESAASEPDGLTERFLESEVSYWFDRAAADEALSVRHEAYANEAARKLSALREEAAGGAR